LKTRFHCLVFALTLLAGVHPVSAQGTAFAYQGKLNDGGAPASGAYDLRFAIYDSTNNPGNVVAGPVTNSATAVTNGLFSVTLDFGPGVFTGPARWIELAVRTNHAKGGFTPLAPRQPLLPLPYAIMAGTASNVLGAVAAGQLTGTVPLTQLPGAVLTNNAAGVNLNGSFGGNGGGLTNVSAATANGIIDPAGNVVGYFVRQTNLTANSLDTNRVFVTGAALAKYNTNLTWNPVLQAWTNGNRAIFFSSTYGTMIMWTNLVADPINSDYAESQANSLLEFMQQPQPDANWQANVPKGAPPVTAFGTNLVTTNYTYQLVLNHPNITGTLTNDTTGNAAAATNGVAGGNIVINSTPAANVVSRIGTNVIYWWASQGTEGANMSGGGNWIAATRLLKSYDLGIHWVTSDGGTPIFIHHDYETNYPNGPWTRQLNVLQAGGVLYGYGADVLGPVGAAIRVVKSYDATNLFDLGSLYPFGRNAVGTLFEPYVFTDYDGRNYLTLPWQTNNTGQFKCYLALIGPGCTNLGVPFLIASNLAGYDFCLLTNGGRYQMYFSGDHVLYSAVSRTNIVQARASSLTGAWTVYATHLYGFEAPQVLRLTPNLWRLYADIPYGWAGNFYAVSNFLTSTDQGNTWAFQSPSNVVFDTVIPDYFFPGGMFMLTAPLTNAVTTTIGNPQSVLQGDRVTGTLGRFGQITADGFIYGGGGEIGGVGLIDGSIFGNGAHLTGISTNSLSRDSSILYNGAAYLSLPGAFSATLSDGATYLWQLNVDATGWWLGSPNWLGATNYFLFGANSPQDGGGLTNVATIGNGAGMVTNNGVVWLVTNTPAGAVPAVHLPNGSICTTTSGAFWVMTNNVWKMH
jgi:hypothetical protein